ncbi:recombinase family protein [Candidatus Parcubacteria bacterium]|nr:recombinase family protein [Candidatus Parcubacteria bacterium]
MIKTQCQQNIQMTKSLPIFTPIMDKLFQLLPSFINEFIFHVRRYRKWGKVVLGEKTGGDVPFGYNVTRNNILIENPAEQKIIELIQRLREKGCSLRAICQELENNNHRTKKGCLKWNPKTVSLILKRPA